MLSGKQEETMHWTKLTAKTGHLIHVNLANAMSVIWNEKENASYIAFPGGREDVLVVIETPEQILKGPGAPGP
jgi:hypothetical protein